MTKYEIIQKLRGLDFGELIIQAFVAIVAEEPPLFSFALREDIKDDKRFLPKRATSGSTGWDVACAFEDHNHLTINPGQYFKIPLGIRCIPEKGYWLECRPRSSSFVKKKIHSLYGVVDYDYRQELYFCGKYDGDSILTLDFGEKLGQLIPTKIQNMQIKEITNEYFDKFCDNETNDRVGGFGSSDVPTLKCEYCGHTDNGHSPYKVCTMGADGQHKWLRIKYGETDAK